MKNKIILLIIPVLLSFFWRGGLAEDSLDLSTFADDSGIEEMSAETSDGDSMDSFGQSETESDDDEEEENSEDEGLSISYGGYVKALAYWTGIKFSDETWEKLQYLKQAGFDAPEEQSLSYMSNAGTRMQLRMEGFIGQKAKMFTMFNLEFNEMNQNDFPDDKLSGQNSLEGNLTLREAYIEFYHGDWTIKAGRQLIAWGYVEGFETPTDRISARDYTYKSSDLGDTRLPSDGLLLSRMLGDNKLDMIYIPVSKTNVLFKYTNYAFQGEPEPLKANGDTSKYALRYSGSLGNLNYAISWVDGVDPQTDVSPDTPPFKPYSRSFNRVQSPGLDLQYAFGDWQAKFAYAEYITEDKDGTDPSIKNRWKKYLVGGEMMVGGNLFNLYFGQILVDNFKKHGKNFLLTQPAAVTNFVSGYLRASFLHGDALTVTALGANYWSGEGDSLDKRFQLSAEYKIESDLAVIFSPYYLKIGDETLHNLQAEVRYSF